MKENDKYDCVNSIKDGLQRTALWRQKMGLRYPHDARNSPAAALLYQLADHADQLSDADWQRLEPHFAVTSPRWAEAVSEASRLVGFKSQSPDLASFVRNLLGLLAEPALS
jgi:hypothetical protein